MVYKKPLPRIPKIFEAAHHMQFPATRDAAIQQLKQMATTKSLIDFVHLFPQSETFESRGDFMTRCEELELLISQERTAPTEKLRSQQD